MTTHDQVRYVVDRYKVHDLHMQYFMNVDRRLWEPVKAVFVPGTLVDYSALLPIGDAVPAEEVVDRIAAAMEIYATTVHNMGNLEVAIDGDVATSECCVVAHHVYADPERQGGRLPVSGLRYRDRLVYDRDLGWRVEHRRAWTDWRAWWEPRGPTYVDGEHQ